MNEFAGTRSSSTPQAHGAAAATAATGKRTLVDKEQGGAASPVAPPRAAAPPQSPTASGARSGASGASSLDRAFGSLQGASTTDSESGEDGGPRQLVDVEGADATPSGSKRGPSSAPPPGAPKGVRTDAHAGGLEDQESTDAVNVTFGTVHAPSTPVGVGDRIPPHVDFAIAVTITGWHPPMAPVHLAVEGAGGGNGEATIDGAGTKDITTNVTIQLQGTAQTAPGKAGRLRLAGTIGTRTAGRSNAFSVAAIPQNFSIAFQSEITGARRGIRVQNSHQSDSGSVPDLDQVQISEVVQYGAGTGVFAGISSGSNSGYRSGTAFPTDSHGTPVSLLTGAGQIAAQQTFKFKDARTGAADIPVAHSGFQITRNAADDGAGHISLTTSKAGHAGTANGNTSAAGSGNASKTQPV